MYRRACLILLFGLGLGAWAVAAPLATGFTYQGSLKANGSPAANGTYDFQFTLYGVDIGGSPLAGPVNVMAQPVTEGVFTAALDFGAAFDGSPRFLEIQVRKVGDPAFVVLSPRQAVTPTPYALRAASVTDNTIVANNIVDASVGTAELADGSVTFQKLADNAVQGNKLAPGSVNASKVNPFEIQLRVAALCARGAPMIGITQAGQPICDHPSGSVVNINSDRVAVVVRSDGRPLMAVAGPRLYDCQNVACTTATETYLPGNGTGIPQGNDVSLALRATDGLPVLAFAAPSGGAQHLLICGTLSCSAGNTIRTLASDSFGAMSWVAVRSDNVPVVGYFANAAGGYENHLAVCNDVTCSSHVMRNLVGTEGHSMAGLRIRPNSTPVVVLRQFTAQTHALYDCNDTSCSSGTVRSLAQGLAGRFVPSLAVRSDNRALVANASFTTGSFLHDCVDAGCSSNNTRVFSAGQTFNQSALAIRSDGRPLVAYVESGTNTLKLFDCANADCTSGSARALDQVQIGSDEQISLTVRSDNRPVLAYPVDNNQVRLLMCASAGCQ